MSQFANALQRLLYDTGVFNRDEWCDFLTIQTIYSPSKLFIHQARLTKDINSWLNDEKIPRPDILSQMYMALKNSYGVIQEPLKEFEKMAKQRSVEVAPGINGQLMLPTVWEYMNRPLFCKLSDKLAKLNDQEKAALLIKTLPGSLGK